MDERRAKEVFNTILAAVAVCILLGTVLCGAWVAISDADAERAKKWDLTLNLSTYDIQCRDRGNAYDVERLQDPAWIAHCGDVREEIMENQKALGFIVIYDPAEYQKGH
jgi:hypothetical protein